MFFLAISVQSPSLPPDLSLPDDISYLRTESSLFPDRTRRYSKKASDKLPIQTVNLFWHQKLFSHSRISKINRYFEKNTKYDLALSNFQLKPKEPLTRSHFFVQGNLSAKYTPSIISRKKRKNAHDEPLVA